MSNDTTTLCSSCIRYDAELEYCYATVPAWAWKPCLPQDLLNVTVCSSYVEEPIND